MLAEIKTMLQEQARAQPIIPGQDALVALSRGLVAHVKQSRSLGSWKTRSNLLKSDSNW